MDVADRAAISILCGVVLLPLAVLLAVCAKRIWCCLICGILQRVWREPPSLPKQGEPTFWGSVVITPLLEELQFGIPLVFAALAFGPWHIITVGVLAVCSLAFGIIHYPPSDEQWAVMHPMWDKLMGLLVRVFIFPRTVFMILVWFTRCFGPLVFLLCFLKPSEWSKPKERRAKIMVTLIFGGSRLIYGLLTLLYLSLLPVEMARRSLSTFCFVLAWGLLPAVLAHSVHNGGVWFRRWCEW